MKKILNIGCGLKRYYSDEKDTEIVNIDKDEFVKPDMVLDVEKGLPFEDNSISQIHSEHFMEHLNPDNVNFFMKECWRVLQPGGLFSAIVPIGESWMSSPFHKAPFNRHTPLFFTTWNQPERTGYEFKLTIKEVRTTNPDVDWQDELLFEIVAIKEAK